MLCAADSHLFQWDPGSSQSTQGKPERLEKPRHSLPCVNDSPNRAILSTIVIKQLSGFTLLEKSLQTHIVFDYYLESMEPGDESKTNKIHTWRPILTHASHSRQFWAPLLSKVKSHAFFPSRSQHLLESLGKAVGHSAAGTHIPRSLSSWRMMSGTLWASGWDP